MERKEYPTPLAELERLQVHWAAEREQAAGYVAHLEASAGRSLLEGSTSHREALASARAAQREAEEVLAEISRQMPTAKALATQAEARQIVARAGKLEDEAAGIEAEVGKLLDQIEILEGCRYLPPPPQSRFGDLPAKSQRLRREAFKLNEQADYLEWQAKQAIEKAERQKEPVAQWIA